MAVVFANDEQASAIPDLVRNASLLTKTLRERIPEAESLRRLPAETVADLKKAGLFRALQPGRCGGLEADLHEFIDAVSTVARGCGSSAWVVAVTGAHHWLIGLFADKAQDDVFSADRDSLISAVISTRGKARKTNGGYILNGFWPFCSGSTSADWVMLGGAVVDDAGNTIDEGEFLIPVSDIEIKDDWNVTSLRASGSNSVVAKEVYVPDYRFLSMPDAIAGSNVTASRYEGSLYRNGVVPVLAIALGPTAVGIAQGAMENFIERLPGRQVIYTFNEHQIDMPVTHLAIADVATKINAARSVLHQSAKEMTDAANAGKIMSLEKRAQVRMDTAYASRLCLEAVETLYLACGGSAVATGHPIQRAWLDLHAINLHGLNCLDTAREMYGRVVLGLPQNTSLI